MRFIQRLKSCRCRNAWPNWLDGGTHRRLGETESKCQSAVARRVQHALITTGFDRLPGPELSNCLAKLALPRESPPCPGLAGTSLMNCGGKYIPNAWIMFSRGLELQPRIELVRIACGQLLDAGDAKYLEINTRCGSNVAKSLEWIADARPTCRRAPHDATSLQISTEKAFIIVPYSLIKIIMCYAWRRCQCCNDVGEQRVREGRRANMRRQLPILSF